MDAVIFTKRFGVIIAPHEDVDGNSLAIRESNTEVAPRSWTEFRFF